MQLFYIRKVGGLYHFRVGRIGGSLYIKSRKAVKIAPQAIDWQAVIAARLPSYV